MKLIKLLFLLCLFPPILQAQKFEELAQKPPMGWNSWNYFECDRVNEQVIMDMADAMVSSGMKDGDMNISLLTIAGKWPAMRRVKSLLTP